MKSILKEIASGQCSAVVADLGSAEAERADVTVGAPGQPTGAGAFLARVESIYGRATKSGNLPEDPDDCNNALDLAESECRTVVASALDAGADGISYRLTGANPTGLSPMEYGGLILERERAVLSDAMDAGFVEVLIEPADENYYDFLSDLPCHLLSAPGASDSELAALTELRIGPLAASAGTSVVRCIVDAKPKVNA